MLSHITKEILEQRERWILFSPVLFGLGIGFYFSLEYEPILWVAIATAATLLAALLLFRKRLAVFYPLLALFLVAVGFCAGALNTHLAGTKIISKSAEDKLVTATVISQELVEGAVRLTLINPKIEGFAPEETPGKIRVTLRGDYLDFTPGDKVSLCTNLYPPPLPAYANEFDAGLAAYMNGIGATGFSTCRAQVINFAEAGGISHVRDAINNRIKDQMHYPENTVAMSLITGAQRTIPERIINDYRNSGIIHILSISGFHIGLLAGLSFWTARFLLALSPFLNLRFSIKKWAAVISLVVTLLYLLISGSQVPAVRSFIMVGFIMLAVMVGRKAISVRNICWAAIFILAFSPESLLTPSFQLSFAATLALVAFYEELAPIMNSRFAKNRIYFYLAGIVATTLIAGMVTAPIVLYHFNQVNNYGLLGNIIAIPLSSFVIMPAAGLAVLFMPIGLDFPFLKITEWGIWVMNKTAEVVGGLPGSTVIAPSFTKAGYIAICLGGLWLLLWHKRIRLAGLVPIAIGFLTIFQASPPNIIADNKNVLVNLGTLTVPQCGKSTDERTRGLATNGSAGCAPPRGEAPERKSKNNFVLLGRKETFATRVWLERVATDKAYKLKELDQIPHPNFSCKDDACIFTHENFKTQIILKKAKNYSACGDCSLVINQASNETLGITRNELEKNGTHIIRFDSGGMIVSNVRTPRGARPWNEY